ncbi:membrane protein [Cupriavidus sp. SK-3]|uniref:TPM domain-containing protein n=1 Tax=Cupriavidus sp. SK-3 TaxID=1470558 RepID=UPI00044C5087|nr:membrane protein [Cupriavidus sp. SK-3]
MKNIKRIMRHLLMIHWQVHRAFPRETLDAIEQAIKVSESMHDGQICFALEGALHSAALLKGQSARDRAIEVFAQLHVWDTEENNGVLIYLLLADQCVEIVADRGLHAKVGPGEWENACREMEAAFRHGEYQRGVIGGIQAVAQHMKHHFPARGRSDNELLDRPVIL